MYGLVGYISVKGILTSQRCVLTTYSILKTRNRFYFKSIYVREPRYKLSSKIMSGKSLFIVIIVFTRYPSTVCLM